MSSSVSAPNLAFVTVPAVILFVLVGAGIYWIVSLYCGRENEYTEILDRSESSVVDEELGDVTQCDVSELSSPQESQGGPATPLKAPLFRKRTVPTPAKDTTAADALAEEIDYFVRHMEDFYATGFYCSVVVLENHVRFADKWKAKSLRDFLRRRPEFRMRSNMSAFKLTALTPFRERDVQVSGKFQCVNINCRNRWDSLCTYADHFQKCKRCHAHVYPYEQNVLTEEEKEEYLRNPMDENFCDATDIAFARKRDAVDILAHQISPVKPVLSRHYQSGHSLNSTGSTQ